MSECVRAKLIAVHTQRVRDLTPSRSSRPHFSLSLSLSLCLSVSVCVYVYVCPPDLARVDDEHEV